MPVLKANFCSGRERERPAAERYTAVVAKHFPDRGYSFLRRSGQHDVYLSHDDLWDGIELKKGYKVEFEIVDDHRSGKIVVELNGRINKCGVISPRFDVCLGDIEQLGNSLYIYRIYSLFL